MASLIGDPSPLRQHVFLCVAIDQAAVEVALRLHADATVDSGNLVRKSHDFFQRERLLAALHGLSNAFSIELDGGPPQDPAALDDAGLQTLLAGLAQAQDWFVIRCTIDRDDAVAAGAAFADRIGALLDRLLPVLHYGAWRRDNDFVSVREALRDHQHETKTRGLVKGDRVRVTRGPFAGKLGVVQATDTKGSLKVLLGSVAVRLSGEDAVKH
ncbi:MAG: KOW motif-containing protein [Proteobacteria bacterium]|nr:KOW motif-containing protein [Pseudomonadota bacterium]